MTTTKRSWGLFIMGAWTMGSICMSIVATENFYTIDRLLESSTKTEFSAAVRMLGHAPARELLRYLSSELNRLYFQGWNVAQLVLGAVALWLLRDLRPHRRPPSPLGGTEVAVLGMLAVVVLMLAYLTPQIVSLGRSLDFVPRDPAPPGMQRFWILHAAYTSLEMLKLAMGVFVAWRISVDRSG